MNVRWAIAFLWLLAQACGGEAAGGRAAAAGASGKAAGAEGLTAGAGGSGSVAGSTATEAGASDIADAGGIAGASSIAGAGGIAGAGDMAAGGGMSTAGAGGSSTGGAPCEPTSAVPETAAFQAPEVGPLGAYQVTFANHCGQTVWPAWGSSGGLDFSVIDTKLWLPLLPASERTVTVYGGVREIGFWGRTGCSFDQAGTGACQTGECGGFVCPIKINDFPHSATVFVLDRGFLGGYNVGLRATGSVCGDHACLANVDACSPMSSVSDACGRTIACNDLCASSPAECCSGFESSCTMGHLPSGVPDVGDLVITFCP